MAIDIYSPKELKYGIAQQTTFGTAEADSAAMIELAGDVPDIIRDVKKIDRNEAHGTRNPTQAEALIHTKGCAPAITYPDLCRHDSFDHFLYNLFQKVVEGAATPFEKTFTFDRTSQPDFTADAGHFMTMMEHDPVASQSLKTKDIITQNMVINCSPNEYLSFTSSMVGRGVPTHATEPTGTWTLDGNSFWHYQDISVATLTYSGSTTFALVGAIEFNISHNLKMVGQDSGEFKTFGLISREITFKFTVAHGAITDKARTAQEAGSAVTGRLGWGHATPGTDDGDLDIAFNGIITDVKPVMGDDIAMTEISGECRRSSTVAEDPITIIMANAVDRTW